MTTDGARRGGGRATAPSSRPWRDRLEDDHEPLFTVGVAADLLGVDSQTLRRLEDALSRTSARPSGNQRRYSRNDLEALDAALRLNREGHRPQTLSRVLELERRLAELDAASPAEDS